MKHIIEKFREPLHEFMEIMKATREGLVRGWSEPVAPVPYTPRTLAVGSIPYTHVPKRLDFSERDHYVGMFAAASNAVQETLIRKGQVNRPFQLGVARPCGDDWYEKRMAWGDVRGMNWASSWDPEQCPGQPRIVVDMKMTVSHPMPGMALDEMISIQISLEQPSVSKQEGEPSHWVMIDERHGQFRVDEIKEMKKWVDEKIERMGIEAYSITLQHKKLPPQEASWTKDIAP